MPTGPKGQKRPTDVVSECRASDLAALRNAAKAYAASSSEGVNFRWIRDGDR